jgi:hypothetical protein
VGRVRGAYIEFVLRAFQMIFAPEGAWWKIAEKNRHFLFVLFISSLPLIAAALALEGFGMDRLGESLSEVGKIRLNRDVIIRYEVIHLGLDVVFLLVGAWILLSLSKSFDGKVGYRESFSTMAYGASPIFLMHALDGLPHVPTWVCWGIGAGLAVRSLYHGVAINMKPEQTKGMGLYIVAAFIVLFLSGLVHFVAVTLLHGRPAP